MILPFLFLEKSEIWLVLPFTISFSHDQQDKWCPPSKYTCTFSFPLLLIILLPKIPRLLIIPHNISATLQMNNINGFLLWCCEALFRNKKVKQYLIKLLLKSLYMVLALSLYGPFSARANADGLDFSRNYKVTLPLTHTVSVCTFWVMVKWGKNQVVHVHPNRTSPIRWVMLRVAFHIHWAVAYERNLPIEFSTGSRI